MRNWINRKFTHKNVWMNLNVQECEIEAIKLDITCELLQIYSQKYIIQDMYYLDLKKV